LSKSHSADHYFAKQDAEKLAAMRDEEASAAATRALAERKTTHWNRCGKCGGEMTTTPFRGSEIEVCPDCGAVLLDYGELQTLAGDDESGMLSGFLSLFGGK